MSTIISLDKYRAEKKKNPNENFHLIFFKTRLTLIRNSFSLHGV